MTWAEVKRKHWHQLVVKVLYIQSAAFGVAQGILSSRERFVASIVVGVAWFVVLFTFSWGLYRFILWAIFGAIPSEKMVPTTSLRLGEMILPLTLTTVAACFGGWVARSAELTVFLAIIAAAVWLAFRFEA